MTLVLEKMGNDMIQVGADLTAICQISMASGMRSAEFDVRSVGFKSDSVLLTRLQDRYWSYLTQKIGNCTENGHLWNVLQADLSN